MDDVIECGFCGGDAYHMGTVGSVAHYRCRHCGMNSTSDTGDFDFGMHEASEEDFSFDIPDDFDGDTLDLD